MSQQKRHINEAISCILDKSLRVVLSLLLAALLVPAAALKPLKAYGQNDNDSDQTAISETESKEQSAEGADQAEDAETNTDSASETSASDNSNTDSANFQATNNTVNDTDILLFVDGENQSGTG